MNFEEVEKKVIQWATDRNIFSSTVSDQYRKLDEEFKELGDAISKGDQTDIMDAIGDMLVVLTLIARMRGVDIFSCYCAAYLQIKDRKGKMVDGIFVKESNV